MISSLLTPVFLIDELALWIVYYLPTVAEFALMRFSYMPRQARSMLEMMKTHHESEIAKIQEAALANQRGSHEEHQAQVNQLCGY